MLVLPLSAPNNNHSYLSSYYLNAVFFSVYTTIVFVHFFHALPWMISMMMMVMMAMTALTTTMAVILYNGLSIGLCKHLMLMVLALVRPDFHHDYLDDLFDGMTFVDYGEDYDNDALIMAV